ncbi:hypothetical protein IHE44_0013346, partial [Lamprotornis superbus]
MNLRKSLSGELVLITGAGHGVGRATALEFAKRRSRLVLWDINKHGVEETAAECQKLGATVQTFVVDCSKREEIYSTADKVKKDIGDVTILVNNAGVITTADFLSTQDHQIEKMFEVNILGHMWTTRAFLPVMMNNNYGHIVTVASAAGHFVTPYMVAYCSSKFAAVGFHKALTEELSALGKDGIKTTCLCPVFINTGFVKNPSTRLGKILEIEEVVEALMEGIVTNQKMVFVPPQLNIALLSELVFPERALNLLKKMTIPKFDALRETMNLFVEVLLFLVTLLYSYLEAFVKLFVPARRKSLSGELVLITGAGHGVGRATALEFAKRRSRLVLWDINKILEIEEVVEALMEGIVTNQKMVFVPSNQGIALLFERVFPERALNLLKKMYEVKFDAVIGQRSTQGSSENRTCAEHSSAGLIQNRAQA